MDVSLVEDARCHHVPKAGTPCTNRGLVCDRTKIRRFATISGLLKRRRLQSKVIAHFQREPAMSDDASFQDLIRRVRGGDDAAAAELVRRYEPAIRRVVRLRLTDARLRRAFD